MPNEFKVKDKNNGVFLANFEHIQQINFLFFNVDFEKVVAG